MLHDTDIEHALRHTREIGGNPSVKKVLVAALGPLALSHKRELRLIGIGCGDDYCATRIEATLLTEGILAFT